MSEGRHGEAGGGDGQVAGPAVCVHGGVPAPVPGDEQQEEDLPPYHLYSAHNGQRFPSYLS